MYPFECYNFEEAISHKTGFTGKQPQVYSILTYNIQRQVNLIPNYKLESKMGTRNTDKNAEPPHGEKASLKSVMLHVIEEERKSRRWNASSFQKLIRYHEGGITKLFKTTITCNNDRVDTTKATRPTNPSNLISTLLFQLESWKCQLHPRFPGRVCHTTYRDKESVAWEV